MYRDCCSSVNTQRSTQAEQIHFNCDVKISTDKYMYSVGKCAKWWTAKSLPNSNQMRDKCEMSDEAEHRDLLDFIPVVSHQTGFVYRNVHCAKCGIENLDLSRLELFMVKSSTFFEDPEEMLADFESAIGTETRESMSSEVFFVKPDAAPNRFCVKNVDKCADVFENLTTKSLCENGPTNYRYFKLTINFIKF
jgi:hypothetical protein